MKIETWKSINEFPITLMIDLWTCNRFKCIFSIRTFPKDAKMDPNEIFFSYLFLMINSFQKKSKYSFVLLDLNLKIHLHSLETERLQKIYAFCRKRKKSILMSDVPKKKESLLPQFLFQACECANALQFHQ